MLTSGDLIVPASSSDSSNVDDAVVYSTSRLNRRRRAMSDNMETGSGAYLYECVARNMYGIDAKIVMYYAMDK